MCHESRFNLFGLLTNSTQRICLVARGGRELVTFRSLSPTLSLYTTRVDKVVHCASVVLVYQSRIQGEGGGAKGLAPP